MNFFELIQKRESCRNYSDKKVELSDITKILEAARLAPSACNSQPWRFAVAAGEKATAVTGAVQIVNMNKWASNVSSYIVVCEATATLFAGATCDSQHYAQLDVGEAVAYITLAAEELGLGTCIIGAFDEIVLRGALQMPDDWKVRLVVAVGYSNSGAVRQKQRKCMEEISR